MRAPHPRQLCALGFGTLSVSAILMLPRAGWLWATAGALAVALLIAFCCRLRRGCAAPVRLLSECAGGRLLLVLMYAGNLLLLGASAARLCDAYPSAGARPLIGLLLLLMAAYAAGEGTPTVGRVAAIGFFFLAALYAVVLAFGAAQAEVRWLKPVTELSPARLTALLAPVSAALLAVQCGAKCRLWTWLTGGVALVFAAAFVTAGVVSPAVASCESFAFYLMSKNVSLFGAMERLEPLVSAALTVGGFALLGQFCAINTEIAGALAPSFRYSPAVNFLLGGGAIWLSVCLSERLLAWLSAIFWGLIPLMALLLVAGKKREKKSENPKKSVDKPGNW